jgi:hypothetical protein
VTGGVTEPSCPYECISDKYHMPHCYTPLEDLIYALGGPWLFGLLLSGLLVLLALVLSVARMKFVGTDEFSGPTPTPHESQIDHSFPFLESLNEVCISVLSSSQDLCSVFQCAEFVNSETMLLYCFLIYRSDNLFSWFCYYKLRFWKPTEPRNPRVMCTGCILWVPILSINHGTCLTHHQMKLLSLCKCCGSFYV